MMTVLVEHDDRLHCHEDGCHGDEVSLYAADPIDFISDIRIVFYDQKVADDSPGVQVFQNVCFLLFDVAKKQ